MHFSGSWQNEDPADHSGSLNGDPYVCFSCVTLATPSLLPYDRLPSKPPGSKSLCKAVWGRTQAKTIGT